jgi:hypothetical protein
MSKQQHTPGPWSVNGFYIDLDVATRIATVSNWRMSGADAFAEASANARLIAAAPELLEALEALAISAPSACCGDFNHKKGDFHEGDEKCPPLDRYEKACLLARAAIAKARGES